MEDHEDDDTQNLVDEEVVDVLDDTDEEELPPLPQFPTVDFFQVTLKVQALTSLACVWYINGRVPTIKLHFNGTLMKLTEYPFNTFIEATGDIKRKLTKLLIQRHRAAFASTHIKTWVRNSLTLSTIELVHILQDADVPNIIVAGCGCKWPLQAFRQFWQPILQQFGNHLQPNFYDVRQSYSAQGISLFHCSPAGAGRGLPATKVESWPMLSTLGRKAGIQYGSLKLTTSSDDNLIRSAILYSPTVNWTKAFLFGRADMTYKPRTYKTAKVRLANISKFAQWLRSSSSIPQRLRGYTVEIRMQAFLPTASGTVGEALKIENWQRIFNHQVQHLEIDCEQYIRQVEHRVGFIEGEQLLQHRDSDFVSQLNLQHLADLVNSISLAYGQWVRLVNQIKWNMDLTFASATYKRLQDKPSRGRKTAKKTNANGATGMAHPPSTRRPSKPPSKKPAEKESCRNTRSKAKGNGSDCVLLCGAVVFVLRYALVFDWQLWPC